MTPSAALLQLLTPLLATPTRARRVYPLLLLARRMALAVRGLPVDPDAGRGTPLQFINSDQSSQTREAGNH